MGCFCKGLCKVLLIIWTVIAMIFSVALIGFMAFKLTDQSKAEVEPTAFFDLLRLLPGSGWYEDLDIVKLNKYTWYGALGLATLMFIGSVIHIISTCRNSRCLLGLGTLLLTLALAANIVGLVFRFQAKNSIDARLEISLNDTIINKYGNSDFDDITDSWNLLGETGNCCGINSGDDFKHATYWSGEVKASTPPCGESIDTGCVQGIRLNFIVIDDIWFTCTIAAKIFLLFMLLMHTMCVCKKGMGDGSGSRDTESYTLVEKR